MKTTLLNTGKILLKREKKSFDAGFCITKEILPALIEKIDILHPDEKKYFDTLKMDKRKTSYLLGKITAKKALGELIEGVDIAALFIGNGIFEFPVVKNSPKQNMQVTISHCDNIAAAFAFPEEHPMGIDIEKVFENKADVIKPQLCDHELQLFLDQQLPLSVSCTIIWTVKEGLSKIFRTGLMADFKILAIKSVEKKGTIYISEFCNFAQYKAMSYHCGSYICSIILPRKTVADFDVFWDSFTNVVLKQTNEG